MQRTSLQGAMPRQEEEVVEEPGAEEMEGAEEEDKMNSKQESNIPRRVDHVWSSFLSSKPLFH